MNCREVRASLRDLPYMTLDQAETITTLISQNAVQDILELGFNHGVSTCYMAAALSEAGRGSIVTIDLEQARKMTPNVEELLDRIGERHRVKVFYEPTSYTWRMMKFLEEDPTPRFDLCYLDGAHNWFVDALAFYLVGRLLRPGGWIIFDDLDWTYATSPALKDTELVRSMPADERMTPQIRKIYELLVKPNPNYHNFRVENDWAYAQKREDSVSTANREIVTEHIVTGKKRQGGVGGMLDKVASKLWGK